MNRQSPTRIYGILGYPVKHSLSPSMHNAAFKALKINAEYKLFEKEQKDLGRFFESLFSENIRGLNVTIPYKEKSLDFLQWISPEVRFIGAVNTIIVKNKNDLQGWNTDGLGFHKHLTQDLRFNISTSRVAILGAGGAAKAVINQLARHKASIITIYDIDEKKSIELAGKINKEFPECISKSVNSIDELNIGEANLLINATSVGMKESDPCLVSADILHPKLLVYDLIYNPAETKLLKEARSRGAKTSNGLGMLLHQGVRSFELWTGQKAPLEVMHNALLQAINK